MQSTHYTKVAICCCAAICESTAARAQSFPKAPDEPVSKTGMLAGWKLFKVNMSADYGLEA